HKYIKVRRNVWKYYKSIKTVELITMTIDQTIRDLIGRARTAQKIAEGFSQRKVDELAAAIVYVLSRPELAKEIAADCVDETDIGDIEAKISKLTNKIPAVFHQVKTVKTVGVIEENGEMGIRKIAKPVGVIAALIPSTNP